MFDRFINELDRQVYADKKVIKEELENFNVMLKKNSLKDKSYEEIIEYLFKDVINEVNLFFEKYDFVPGMNITSKINDVIINFSIGYKDFTKKELLDINTMFDIASISKTPTAILIYQLIEEKLLNMNEKVKNILREYNNLSEDLYIRDLLSYRGKYLTNGRIDDAKDKKEALKLLKSVVQESESLNSYNYNDIVPILCGEIVKKISNSSLEQLLNKRVIKPLNIQNIAVNNQIDLEKLDITGSPNKDRGLCNDPKANILEGYPGSAGLFCSTNDIIVILENLLKGNLIKSNSDFYTRNPLKISRGIAGQSIVPTEIEQKGYYSNLSPIMSLGEDGSTRTIATSGKYVLNKQNYYVSEAIFTNACSSDPEIIKYYEKKNNNPEGSCYKYYENIDAYRVDIRKILPSNSMDNILFTLQKFNLRVSLLNACISFYEKNYKLDETINLKYRKRWNNENPR